MEQDAGENEKEIKEIIRVAIQEPAEVYGEEQEEVGEQPEELHLYGLPEWIL